MKNVGIFYATISKNTEHVAKLISTKFNSCNVELHNLMDIQNVVIMKKYDLLIFGSPTYGKGDAHYLWHEIFEEMIQVDFGQLPFAIFCLGDQIYHTETFGGAMNIMASNLKSKSLNIIGYGSSSDYSFLKSLKVDNPENIPGLIIDEKNQPELTEARVEMWCKKLNSYIL